MPEPATPEERTAFRRTLRKAAFPAPDYFGPVPERVEITYCTEFCGDACVCSLAAASWPVTHVIYCRGCKLAWIEPSEYEPGCCACECTDVNDPLYEAWVTDPDPADVPPGAWAR